MSHRTTNRRAWWNIAYGKKKLQVTGRAQTGAETVRFKRCMKRVVSLLTRRAGPKETLKDDRDSKSVHAKDPISEGLYGSVDI